LANRSTVLTGILDAQSQYRNIDGTISRIEEAIAENSLQQASQLLNRICSLQIA
jgi:hypothetical protein